MALGYFRYRSFLLLLLACLLSTQGMIRGTAFASFTLDDERKLGREFYEQIEKSNLLLKNDFANAYVTTLGERILAHSDPVPFEFKFSIVRSSAINAFATPGGYVYLNQGLITLVENEGELAGVLAHEIAHINGRHVAELVDRSQKISYSTLAAILAGAFLGGAATSAIASFSVATAATLNLKYSREHEEAADRMGMSYLVAAGYNGKGMLNFLRIMKRYEFYSNSIPSYFLTHPGTDERIRYIDALIQTTYKKSGNENITGRLRRVQTMLLIDGKSPDANLAYFQRALNDNPGDPDFLYGLAITQDKLGMVQESLANFRKALSIAPNDADILRDLGILLFKIGQPQNAAVPLQRAFVLNEKDANTLLYLGKTHEALGDIPRALDLYRRLEDRHVDDQEIFYNLAMAYGKAGHHGDSHYYFGLYFKKQRKVDSALFHFREAAKYFPSDTVRARDIAKEIASLKR